MDATAQNPIDVEEHKSPFDHETASQKPASQTLTDMGREWELFTTAILSRFGKFDRDPVVEAAKLRGNVRPVAINSPRPLFQGLGPSQLLGEPVNWDHRLYAVKRDEWEPFRDVLAGIAWVDRPRKIYSQTFFYELEMVDPTLFYQRGGLLTSLPLLTITVFGVATNRGLTYLAPATDPPHTRPFPQTDPPRPEEVQKAERLFAERATPAILSRHRKDSP